MTDRTGWPPGLLQDDDRKLSKWLSARYALNARLPTADEQQERFMEIARRRYVESFVSNEFTPTKGPTP